jgi:hypothetical protein
MLKKGEIVRRGDQVKHYSSRGFITAVDSIGRKVGVSSWFIRSKVRRPLKTAVAASSTSSNTGYTAALWKELERTCPESKVKCFKSKSIAITKTRLNAAIKKLQHCA